ncbi:hypothetical protein HanIR_Chr04g0174151 [Helianthus annuus]|nr:hypothetical protein HanIR_Chr04g0174151 [Helianthus annuus]
MKSFEVFGNPSNTLSSIDDPSDHLSNPSDQTSDTGYINTHVVCCFQRDLRDLLDRCTHRESLRAFYQNTHTH